MRRSEGNTIVENLDKPIMAFAGTIAGRAGMKLMERALTSMNPKLAEFAKASITTIGALIGYQKANEQHSENAQYFFVGMAAAGVGKAVEVISGGELNGWIDGLGSTATALPDPNEIYSTSTGNYGYEVSSDLHLPVLEETAITESLNADTSISGTLNTTSDNDLAYSYNNVEDVAYEEVYEID